MYLTEKIGLDYQTWKPGDVIMITAPTGAGKSYFIQREYLKWIVCQDLEKMMNPRIDSDKLLYKENQNKILYLVNRKILKNK